MCVFGGVEMEALLGLRGMSRLVGGDNAPNRDGTPVDRGLGQPSNLYRRKREKRVSERESTRKRVKS